MKDNQIKRTVGRPQKAYKKAQFSLDLGIFNQLKAQAAADGVTMTSLLETALNETYGFSYAPENAAIA